ncbi:uncharacterized protein LOC126838479 isoform X4 [Adelges cooleyi]|uniref:uncharacterized protein LOC126838479 isoform X3 n=1 Tax=Adelges cooleyi TaxID=133065 RepID=UPI0021805438|nr:uncharacterized protein LOC126838479 isoform X3 [Adelges cooleyi]XP_050428919.1 uncharacterized protein LOC126838479 isoform X4 [Adelges cooleyi]
MKQFGFFIFFLFVNISADKKEIYLRPVYLTNAAIKCAYNINDVTVGDNSKANGLEHVIETMVDDKRYVNQFAKINFMIALPDQTEIVLKKPDWKGKVEVLENKTDVVLGIPVSDFNHTKEFENLVENGKELPRHILYKRELKSAGNHQYIMHEEMVAILGQRIRDAINIEVSEYYKHKNSEKLDLSTLANERREFYVAPALKHILTRELEASVQRVDDDVSLLRVCRFIGIYISTQLPDLYITDLQIDSTDGTCTLWDKCNTPKRYRKINGSWSQISLDDLNDAVAPLEQQLRLGFL